MRYVKMIGRFIFFIMVLSFLGAGFFIFLYPLMVKLKDMALLGLASSDLSNKADFKRGKKSMLQHKGLIKDLSIAERQELVNQIKKDWLG